MFPTTNSAGLPALPALSIGGAKEKIISTTTIRVLRRVSSFCGLFQLLLWLLHMCLFSPFLTGYDSKKIALHYNVSLSTIQALLGPGLTALPALGQRWGRIMNNQDGTPNNKM
jgi:hypothetical protein